MIWALNGLFLAKKQLEKLINQNNFILRTKKLINFKGVKVRLVILFMNWLKTKIYYKQASINWDITHLFDLMAIIFQEKYQQNSLIMVLIFSKTINTKEKNNIIMDRWAISLQKSALFLYFFDEKISLKKISSKSLLKSETFVCNSIHFKHFRYNKMLKTDEFKDVDSELAQQTFDLLHGLICTEDASDSWYETSCHNRFEWSDGDWILGWKDKGFVTVLDLLQVNAKNRFKH